jgi:Fe2+ transport system protein FeoA
VEILGDPGACPHGNPIPGSANARADQSEQVCLADMEPGRTFRFERLEEEVELDEAALRYLSEAGFIPGVTASVTTRGPDGTLVLDVDGTTLALGRDLSSRFFVAA